MEKFMADTVEFVRGVIADAEQSNVAYEGIFTDNAQSVGKCRWCGKNVYQKSNAYRCESETCGFYICDEKNLISEYYYKKRLSREQIKNLLSTSGLTLRCKNKQQLEYIANFKIKSKPIIEGGKKHIALDISFMNDAG